jgi:hypothetical protein
VGKADGKKHKRGRAAAGDGGGFDLQTRLLALDPARGAEEPEVPIDGAVLEALRLRRRARKLRDALLELPGFDARAVDELGPRAEALRAADAAWQALRDQSADAPTTTVALRRQAEGLRADLLASARFHLRKLPDAQRVLDELSPGSRLRTLAADLAALVELCRQHAAAWAKESLLPGDVLEQAASLGQALLALPEEPPEAAQAFERRNLTFWLLDDAVEEVRAGARYLYRREPKKLRPFLSRKGSRKPPPRRPRGKEFFCRP